MFARLIEDDMLEIARQLEQTAVWFNPVILIGPGLAAVLLGLFIWLGGLGFKRALVVTVGAVSGGVCGFFISGRNIVTATVSAVLAAVLAVVLERIFITILAGVLTAILAFAILAGPYIGNADEQTLVEWNETKKLSTSQTVEIVKAYTSDFVDEIKWISSQMPVYNWIMIAILAVIFLAAGFLRRRLTSAFCCAALGTMLIFAGMILLLLYKGAAPVSRICKNQSYYLGVFAVMTAFGMVEQLLFCQRIRKRLTRKKGEGENENESEDIPTSWRNR